MARQETILSVFVASPSDVDEERNRLEEVIRELNTAWARELGIRLDLVRWETHAYPGFGEDPQSVINAQVPDDFDLFIGIMWYKFGTPTNRAGSGTLEEFQRAKERFERNPSALQLMIYFKDAPAPLPPSKLDPEQITKISQFRSCLGKEGGLYWCFSNEDEFEKLIRLHLARHVQAWRSKNETPISTKGDSTISKNEAKKCIPTVQDDEPGLLDLMEQFEDEFDTLKEITERIAAATADIGEKMRERTEEINQFQSGPDSANRKTAKRLITKAAADIEQYVHRIDAELPLFNQHLNVGMNALIQASQIAVELTVATEGLDQARANIENVRDLHENFTSLEESILNFQGSVASLPKMTTTLNRAKRSAVSVLQRLIEEIRGGQTMAREAELSFNCLLQYK